MPNDEIPAADPRTPEMAVFLRKARQAAHQCLYFLYLLRKQQRWNGIASGEDGGVWPARSIFDRLVNQLLERRGLALAPEALDAYRAFAHRQMSAIVGVVRTPPQSDENEVVKAWNELGARLAAPDLPADGVQPLIESCGHLLDVSAPRHRMDAFDAFLRQVLLLLLRNVALILTGVAVWAVFFKVEAVRSLVWNAGIERVFGTWSPLVFVFVTASLDIRIEPKELGRTIWWAIRHQARPPEPGIKRWPPGMRFVEHAIFARQFVKLVIALTIIGVVGLIFWRWGGPTTLTIFIIAALCLLALITAHALDSWDFLEAIPLRFLALFSLVAIVGFSTAASQYRLIAVIGTVGFGAWSVRAYTKRTPLRWLHLAAAIASGLFAALVLAGVAGFELISATLAFFITMLVVAVWRSVVLFEPNRRVLANWVLALLSVYVVCYSIESEVLERRSIWHENAEGGAERIARGAWPLAGDAPVVLVAASGGGSRAAIYTAFTLERLNHDDRDIADQIQAVSSVSGGSLAAAAYVARRYNWGKKFGDWAKALPDEIEPGELVTAVSDDFLQSTLWGALWPLTTRGDSIEDKWRDGPAMLRDHRLDQPPEPKKPGVADDPDDDLTIADLKAGWDDAVKSHARTPPFPLPLFNTCTLDQHDVVISPLTAAYYTKFTNGAVPDQLASAVGMEKTDWLTWVADRDAIYGLDGLLPKYNVALPKAVRASANFPFGFPLVALNTKPDRNFFEDPRIKPRSDVKLTDGGVLSNSGLWPLYPLLTDGDLTAELKRRGVLLIIVEASKMPEYSADRRDITTLYGDLNNRNPVAQALHRRMIEGLKAHLDGAIAIEQIDIIPRAGVKSTNVMTTWALDLPSQRTLKESFRATWKTEGPRIHDAWACLRRSPGEKKACLDGLNQKQDRVAMRPPLD